MPPAMPGLQQKPEGDEVVRITTNLVQVDAVITDKNGKVVTDLKPDEVQISEDGKVQEVTNFSFVAVQSPVPASKDAPGKIDPEVAVIVPNKLTREQVKRTIAIVVDDLGLSYESVSLVRHALRQFVDEYMQAGDLVGIIRTRSGSGALQQFTSDKRQLYTAIDRIKWYAPGRGELSPVAPIGRDATGADIGAGADAAKEDLDAFRADVLGGGTLQAISYVVQGLQEFPGRKSVLLISDGFPLDGDPTHNTRVLELFRKLTDQANRASVVINAMHAAALQPLGFTAQDNTSTIDMRTGNRIMNRPDQNARLLGARSNTFSKSQDGLIMLAENTGGISIRNNNDLANGVKRVIDDQNGYYLIGYRPDESTFDQKTGRRTFHHLSLKIKRPGKFNVRMRNGFFGVTDEHAKPVVTREQKLTRALVSPFAASGVRLQLTSLFTNDATEGSVMKSMVHIDARDLTFIKEADGWHKCVFDLVAVSFGTGAVPIDQVSKTHTVRLREDTYQRVLRDGFVYAVMVPVKSAGGYQLRVALRDAESDRMGSASQFVEIPDLTKNRLALSGIAAYALSQSEYARAGQKTGGATGGGGAMAATSEGLDVEDAQAGPAVRRFHQGSVMQYGFVIFNAQLDKTARSQLTTQMRLVRDGKVVFTGEQLAFDPAGQSDSKRMVGGGAIQLGSELPPGEYVLQIIVKDSLAPEKRRTASQWIDFEIVK